ncbi:hypothetical protein ABZ679_35435, partial [Streptomyces fimicarius]
MVRCRVLRRWAHDAVRRLRRAPRHRPPARRLPAARRPGRGVDHRAGRGPARLGQRTNFLYTVAGLTDEQARTRSTVSELTLGGL